ncbi:histidine triad nucleotide-binding protein [bacterium]|nr:histidine triad nucleotide-binding protein [bacterium]
MSSCLFCDIAAGAIPCDRIHADDHLVAFRDIAPQAPTHILIIPRRHIASMAHFDGTEQDLAGAMLVLAAQIAAAEGLAEDGYRCVINCGDNGGQTVGHLHLHLLGGRSLSWPPG